MIIVKVLYYKSIKELYDQAYTYDSHQSCKEYNHVELPIFNRMWKLGGSFYENVAWSLQRHTFTHLLYFYFLAHCKYLGIS